MQNTLKIKCFRAVGTVVLTLCSACSVKEVRTDCPCRLEIGLDTFAEVSPAATVEIGSGPAVLENRTVQLSPQPVLRTDIPHRDITLSVFTPGTKMERSGDLLLTSPLHDADSLYAFRQNLSGTGRETVRTRALAHKQFAQVTLRAVHATERTVHATFFICSDTGGLDLRTLRPSRERAFRYPADLSSGADAFLLPRQDTDSDIRIVLDDGRSPVSEFPLGEWIRESGFDWTAEDLDDLVVDLDFDSGRVYVEITGPGAADQWVLELEDAVLK